MALSSPCTCDCAMTAVAATLDNLVANFGQAPQDRCLARAWRACENVPSHEFRKPFLRVETRRTGSRQDLWRRRRASGALGME